MTNHTTEQQILFVKAKNGDTNILSNQDTYVITDNQGRTPLHILCIYCKDIKTLIKHSMITTLRDHQGKTPLHLMTLNPVDYTAMYGHPDFDEVKDDFGYTPKDLCYDPIINSDLVDEMEIGFKNLMDRKYKTDYRIKFLNELNADMKTRMIEVFGEEFNAMRANPITLSKLIENKIVFFTMLNVSPTLKSMVSADTVKAIKKECVDEWNKCFHGLI